MTDQQPTLGLWAIAREEPGRLTIVDPDHRQATAGELADQSNQVVHALRDLGMQVDDVVAVLVPNSIEYIAIMLGVQQAGFHLVPINFHLSPSEVAYIVGDSGAKAFISHERFADIAIEAAKEISLGDDARIAIGEVEGFRSYTEWLGAFPTDAPSDRTAGELMAYTSGTTGRPKGVKRPLMGLDPDQRAAGGTFLNMLFGMTDPSHVHLVQAPLYHTAVTNFAQAGLHGGHTLVLMDKWTPEGTLERIERYGVSTTHMVPTMFNRLLKLPQETKDRYDVSSLRYAIHSAAPCPIPTKQAMFEWWGDAIWEYYAASEGGGTIASPEDWLKKPGTVGKPWPISELKIIDDDGNELAPGEIGTVWMRMGEMRFKYHGDEEKTNKAWNELGFFTVGDVGELDEDGFLFLRDRKVDMIISGGVNIYPAEIEAVLSQHPKVIDCAVFGIPNDDWGEEVKAAVQLIEGEDATEDDILEFLRGELGGYKVPRSVDFHDQLPRDPNGKLYKRKLRDPYWEGKGSALV